MKRKHLLATSVVGLIALILGPSAVLAQEETFDVRIGVLSPIQNPQIRFVEARELAFTKAVANNAPAVAAIFAGSQATSQSAQRLSQDLQRIGVGGNSQMALTLMETTNCVPDSVNALIDESEQARLAIVSQARQ